eukprot:1175451-Prorocentrum_minimum.AAC.3
MLPPSVVDIPDLVELSERTRCVVSSQQNKEVFTALRGARAGCGWEAFPPRSHNEDCITHWEICFGYSLLHPILLSLCYVVNVRSSGHPVRPFRRRRRRRHRLHTVATLFGVWGRRTGHTYTLSCQLITIREGGRLCLLWQQFRDLPVHVLQLRLLLLSLSHGRSHVDV